MKKLTEKQAQRQEAIRHLRKLLKPGDTVYCVLRHVSSSGVSRRIDFYAIKHNAPVFLSGWMAQAIGLHRSQKHDGLTVSGCGMDRGFHVVYELSRCLYPKGFVPAKAGKSYGRNGTDANEVNPDGGYALNSRWT